MVGSPDSPKTLALSILLWLTALSLGMYFRLYPYLYQTTADLYNRATLVVLSRLQTTARLHIRKNFPDKSELQKKYLAKRYFDKILREEKEKIRKSIAHVYHAFSQKQPSAGASPYLLEADPYNYYGLTKNIVEKGTLSPVIKGSKYFNERMLAPLGHWEPLNLNPYMGYSLYRFLKVFQPDIPLMLAVSFVPLLITVLTSIVFWRLLTLLECSRWANFFSSIFFLLSPIFVKRSAFGWYDNDPYNIFFPLLILLVFFLGLNKKSHPKQCFALGGLGALTITLYAYFWQGWVYILCLLFPAGLLIILYTIWILRRPTETKTLSLYLAIVNIGTFLSVSLAFGLQDFFLLFKEGWQALKNFLEPQLNLWPDMFIGVGELRKISLPDLIDLNGGVLFFTIAMVGFLGYGARAFGTRAIHECPLQCFTFIILFLLTAFSLFTALRAQRFALLSLIPLSIFFALGVQCLFDVVQKRFIDVCFSKSNKFWKTNVEILTTTNDFNKKKVNQASRTIWIWWVSRVLVATAVVLMLIVPVRNAHEEMLFWRPIYNETWDTVMTKIRQQTPPESIINAWWPPGHFITSMAQRRVTFDGATINFPQAYWMANVFLNQDEASATGILRMLNNSANQAVDYLQKCGLKLSAAVAILRTITKTNRETARLLLKDRLSQEQMEELLRLTHALPVPSYLFVYSEQIEKNLELSFVGKWDFQKMEELHADPLRLSQLPPRNSPAYIRFLWDSVGGPWRNSELLPEIIKEDDTIVFDKGITVDLKAMRGLINSKEFGQGVPRYLIYFDGNAIREVKQDNSNLNISLLVIKEPHNRTHCQVIDYALAHSLLFRLYYFQGQGLKYFQPFIHEADLTGRTDIYVYKIDWEKFLKDIEVIDR